MMLSDKIHTAIYNRAFQMAEHSPQIGAKLAGNCTSISYGLLLELRESLDDEIQLVVGFVSMNETTYFKFSDYDLKSWLSGDKIGKYSMHCWLTVDQEIVDVTLAATFKEIDPGLLPENTSFINSEIASRLGITYHQRLVGDDVLQKLGLFRQYA